MKIELEDALAVGGMVLAAVGFTFGAVIHSNYKEEKQKRNDDKVISAVHANWAEFCTPAVDGDKAASAKHAEVDKFISNHSWFSDEQEKVAHELNAHYLTINM